MFSIFKRRKFIALSNTLLSRYKGKTLYHLFKEHKKDVLIKRGKPSDKIKEEFDVIISFSNINELKNWRIS